LTVLNFIGGLMAQYCFVKDWARLPEKANSRRHTDMSALSYVEPAELDELRHRLTNWAEKVSVALQGKPLFRNQKGSTNASLSHVISRLSGKWHDQATCGGGDIFGEGAPRKVLDVARNVITAATVLDTQ
jgi:hypothetical protein